MIEFYCEHCGQKISAPKVYSGKKFRCPKCRNLVDVPQAESANPIPYQSSSVESPPDLKYSNYDLTLLNIREKVEIKNLIDSQTDVSKEAGVDQKDSVEEVKKAESAADRRFHWLIDIFLYPFSLPGLKNLAIFVGLPPLMFVLLFILPAILMYLFSIIVLVVNCLIILYMFWYFAECIRDSAEGWVRAPQGMGALPDMSDLLRQMVHAIGCLMFFLLPAVLYIGIAGRIDVYFLLLMGIAIFFYPIGFLSVILFDSVSGFNPRVLVRSIYNTFIPYLGLVLLYVFLAWLIWKMLLVGQDSILWILVVRFIVFYAAFIVAHLTGRFYWRYQDKLQWNLESQQEQQSND
jgi:hypothetical protein